MMLICYITLYIGQVDIAEVVKCRIIIVICLRGTLFFASCCFMGGNGGGGAVESVTLIVRESYLNPEGVKLSLLLFGNVEECGFRLV